MAIFHSDVKFPESKCPYAENHIQVAKHDKTIQKTFSKPHKIRAFTLEFDGCEKNGAVLTCSMHTHICIYIYTYPEDIYIYIIYIYVYMYQIIYDINKYIYIYICNYVQLKQETAN